VLQFYFIFYKIKVINFHIFRPPGLEVVQDVVQWQTLALVALHFWIQVLEWLCRYVLVGETSTTFIYFIK